LRSAPIARQHRIIDFKIDTRAARLGQHGGCARLCSGHERAAADFADHQTAAQQFRIDPACRRDGDVALEGEGALRRQAIARLQGAPAISAATASASLAYSNFDIIAPRAMFLLH